MQVYLIVNPRRKNNHLPCRNRGKMRKLTTLELNRLSPEEFKLSQRLPLVVVLDNVRSGHNVGSVFRTCDAFGVTGLYLCGITPFPPNREVMKTSLGSDSTIDWFAVTDAKKILQELKESGFEIIFSEHTTHSISLNEFKPSRDKKYAFVFGNEVDGIQHDLLPFADHAVEIPQFGTKHSFNISVAAGIVIWDFFVKYSRD